MGRSNNRRAAARRGPDRRLLGAVAALVVFGGIIGVTQISNADTTTPEPSASASTSADKQVNGLTILTNTCQDSSLPPHDGFQIGGRCVSTEFGEVGVSANNPSLLITRAPRSVAVNTPFSIIVSTRNLIRDRFLAAGKGGYFVESSVLQDGIVRGHFHTACRMLSSTSAAPDPAPVPAFFVATEDSKGGREPDTVTVNVPGLPTAGLAQCASWAGDGSHRIPMMERANQTPALDAVRIQVRRSSGGGDQPGGGTSGQPGGTSGQPDGTGSQPGGGTSGQPGGTGGQPGGTGSDPSGNPSSGPSNSPSGEPSTGPSGQPSSSPSGEPNGGAAVPPPPVKSDPTTEGTVTPTRSSAAPTGGSAGPGSGGNGNSSTSSDRSGSTSARGGSTSAGGDDARGNESAGTRRKTAPASSTTSKKATTAETGDEDTQALLDPNANPDPESDAQQQSAQAAADNGLALTGTNTVMAVGGGLILLIVGLFILNSTTRRRRVRHWRL
jgi:hypothetical protein